MARSAASISTSRNTPRSASDSFRHVPCDTMVSRLSVMWPVSEMWVCTSWNFLAWMVGSGFSCPSTVPLWSARYTSAKAMGVALAPIARVSIR